MKQINFYNLSEMTVGTSQNPKQVLKITEKNRTTQHQKVFLEFLNKKGKV